MKFEGNAISALNPALVLLRPEHSTIISLEAIVEKLRADQIQSNTSMYVSQRQVYFGHRIKHLILLIDQKDKKTHFNRPSPVCTTTYISFLWLCVFLYQERFSCAVVCIMAEAFWEMITSVGHKHLIATAQSSRWWTGGQCTFYFQMFNNEKEWIKATSFRTKCN